MQNNKRLSNIELLRIVSMFLVMIFHVTDAIPHKNLITENSLDDILLRAFSSLSIICVDVFILISGYFGINFKIKGIIKLVFQVIFLSLVIYSFLCFTRYATFNLKDIWHCTFGIFSMYWFVWAYILLYIFSPVLNAFVKNSSKKEMSTFLISYYAFALYIYCTLKVDMVFYKGFHTLAFIGLYLLGRYIKFHNPKWSTFTWKKDIGIYLISACLSFLLMMIMTNAPFEKELISQKCGNYISPTTLISSVFFFLAFTKFRFESKIINYCASSAFAAYILHQQFDAKALYYDTIGTFYSSVPLYIFYPMIIIMLILLFMAFIIIDKIRIYTYNLFF
ncbi:acyltransferase [Prevotella intermedia]|uniref:acyltransferase n=1 Tax=Prevotella intermedia TaxID=28131 RepID=UPI00397A54B5